MSQEVLVSREIHATRPVVWAALRRAGLVDAPDRETVGTELRLDHGLVRFDVVRPAEGARGTGLWSGHSYRVSIHLADRGPDATLFVVTAEPDDQVDIAGSTREHHHPGHDVRKLADEVQRIVTAAPHA
jgi:hypothetical protein